MANYHRTVRRSGSGSSTSTRYKNGNTTTTINTNSKGKINITTSIRSGDTTYSDSHSIGGNESSKFHNERYNWNSGNGIDANGGIIQGLAILAIVFFAVIIAFIATYLLLLFFNSPGISIAIIINKILNKEANILVAWIFSTTVSFGIFFHLDLYLKGKNIKFYWSCIVYSIFCALITTTSFYINSDSGRGSIANEVIYKWSYGKINNPLGK